MANFPSSVKSFTTRLTDDTIAASHMNDVQDEINAIEDEFLNGITVDIAFDDSKALVFGTGLDAHIEYDGTDLIISPAAVGAGDVVISGGRLEVDDNEGVAFGTGKDALISYDGTDLVVDPAIVGTGRFYLDGQNGATALELASGASAMELRIREPSGGGVSYTGFKAPALAGNVVYTLPTADGSASQSLQTDGSAGLSWGAGGATANYTATLADVVSSTSETEVLKFTVPVNTWADGEVIIIRYVALDKNNRGSTGTTTFKINCGAGSQITLAAQGYGDSATEFTRPYEIHLYRRGGTVEVAAGNDAGGSRVNTMATFVTNPASAGESGRFVGNSTPTNFTSDFDVSLKVTLSNNHATYYHKPNGASVIKFSGNT